MTISMSNDFTPGELSAEKMEARGKSSRDGYTNTGELFPVLATSTRQRTYLHGEPIPRVSYPLRGTEILTRGNYSPCWLPLPGKGYTCTEKLFPVLATFIHQRAYLHGEPIPRVSYLHTGRIY